MSEESNVAAVIFQLPIGVMILYTGGYVFLHVDYDFVSGFAAVSCELFFVSWPASPELVVLCLL